MAEIEKGSSASGGADEQPHTSERPMGIKGIYYHPVTQVSMLGFVCFMCPGLFNALNGLGAGGQVDSTTSANANAALYATFAFAAFFAGSINNKLGSRLTLLLGSTGYSLYIGSYLAMNIHPNAGGFVIAAGAILGICAGLLWAAQGSLMLAYPTEGQKGRFISIFWAIFNLGGVVGASVSLGQNFHSTSNSVGNGTYVRTLIKHPRAFLIAHLDWFSCAHANGVTIPLFMVDPKNDSNGWDQGNDIATSLLEDRTLWPLGCAQDRPNDRAPFSYVLCLQLVYYLAINEYNGAIFNIRARSLNNLVYWIAQIIGSVTIGILLDHQISAPGTRILRMGRTPRHGFHPLPVNRMVKLSERQYTRESIPPDTQKMDIHDPGYTTSYWIMGAMSNDPAKLAHFAGFYKSIQSAGAAGVWRADAVKLPYMNVFLSTWILLAAGLIFALPMLYLRVKNHTDITDEALARMDDTGRVRSPEEAK
ncbi:hypothetical protein BD779DRAFT_1666199 [Infundibulicybe gibba]|nr:hypothetical protein BD779DRAFT_1666199 [Infundibulicybe gibba]